MGRKRDDTELKRRAEIAGTLRAMGDEYANVDTNDVILGIGGMQHAMGLKCESAARERIRVWNVANSGSGYNFQTAENDGTVRWNVLMESWLELNLKPWTLQSSLEAGNGFYESHKSQVRCAASQQSRKRSRSFISAEQKTRRTS